LHTGKEVSDARAEQKLSADRCQIQPNMKMEGVPQLQPILYRQTHSADKPAAGAHNCKEDVTTSQPRCGVSRHIQTEHAITYQSQLV
jgi:hypothetical protein